MFSILLDTYSQVAFSVRRANQRYLRNLPTDELICLPFLDTEVAGQIAAADAELQSRGISQWMIRVYRQVARIGLWYQGFAWEWGSLGIYDVLLGYSALIFAAALFTALPGLFSSALVILVAAIISLVVGILGLYGRRQ